MAGSIATNPHEGSRSEIIADYLFSNWGTVTPVRRQDDHGVDLYCTLTEPVGRKSVVTDYYSVQVKSVDDPWVIEGTKEIRWLTDHPTPVFLAIVDKSRLTLAVYHTQARFLAAFWPGVERLELVPGTSDEGRSAQWQSPDRFDLSAPILRVGLSDLLDSNPLAQIGKVLKFWVNLDTENSGLRRVGVLRFRMPYSYRVNEVPAAGFVEQGNTQPTPDQLRRGVLTTFEVVDCVAHQLLACAGDQEGALLACFLLRHLRTEHRALFVGDLRWGGGDGASPFEVYMATRINERLFGNRPASWLFEGLNDLLDQIHALKGFEQFVGKSKATSAD